MTTLLFCSSPKKTFLYLKQHNSSVKAALSQKKSYYQACFGCRINKKHFLDFSALALIIVILAAAALCIFTFQYNNYASIQL
jgi:hypothetical protein